MSSSKFAGHCSGIFWVKWQNEYLPNVKFCQVLSGYCVAEIRRTEPAKYRMTQKS